MALLNAYTTTQASGIMAQNQTPSAKVEKLKRPTVSADVTSEDWEYFLTRWGEYHKGTRLTGEDIMTHLLECCDEGLRKDLTNAAGKSLAGEEEKTVLEAMKALAVHGENTMVATVLSKSSTIKYALRS